MAIATSGYIKTNWSPELKHSSLERWICIYPAYINSKKTRQEGRRLPQNFCVENPTCNEIKDVLTVTHLNFVVENKQYPREKSKELPYRGRVRVQLKEDDGSPCNQEFPTRDSLLIFLGSKIPQLKTRQNKSSDSNQSQQSQTSGAGHKKGKGKRR